MRQRKALPAALLACLLGLTLLAGCGDLRNDRDDRDYEIAGGGMTGVYYAYGEQIAAAMSRDLGMHVSVSETNGSVENLRRIGSQQAILGFAQGDAAADAIAGVGTFSESLPILVVARLYDEYVHVVVRADSDIQSIADLDGRKISLGAENSGVTVVARRILEAAGVSPESVQNPQLSLDASIGAIERGDIEGFFWMGGLPTPGIAQLANSIPTRLLPVSADIVEGANSRHSGVYRLAEFPVGAYGRDELVSTMTVPSFLVTFEDAPADLIRDALRVLFEHRTEIAQFVPAAALLDRRQAIFTDPLDLHPGAVEYYSTTRR